MDKAVFLDRDGIINVDTGYPHKPEELELCPDIVPFLAHIWQHTNFKVLVVSNQSGIRRGMYEYNEWLSFNQEITWKVEEEFLRKGLTWDQFPWSLGPIGFYSCLHTPEDDCACRKPSPGLLYQAAIEHEIDLKGSYFIEDKEANLFRAVREAGVFGIWVDRKGGIITNSRHRPYGNRADVRDLRQALKIILEREEKR